MSKQAYNNCKSSALVFFNHLGHCDQVICSRSIDFEWRTFYDGDNVVYTTGQCGSPQTGKQLMVAWKISPLYVEAYS